MPGYKKACEYCGELVPPDANVCPFCGRSNPAGPARCPKCKSPIERTWKVCSNCSQPLVILCMKCGKQTFFGDYCDACGARLAVICPNPKCGFEQPPVGEKCVKCGKPLYQIKK